MSERAPIVTVEHSEPRKFEAECGKLIKDGYRMASSHCGLINSEEYDFCSIYQAVFVDRALDAREGEPTSQSKEKS